MSATQPQPAVAAVPHVLGEAQYLLIAKLVMPASAFILLVLIGRHSDQLLGEYALVTTYYYVMQALPLLGLTPFVMREVARDNSSAGAVFIGIGGLALLACGVLASGWWSAREVVNYTEAVKRGIDIVALGIFGGILAFLAESILISLHRARLVAMVAVAENAARLIASVAVMRYGGDVGDLLWVVVLGRLVALLILGTTLLRSRWGDRPIVCVGDLLKRTFPVVPAFLGATLLALAASRLNYFVLSIHIDAAALGYYAIAYRLLEIALMVVTAVVTSMYPRLSRLYHERPEDFQSYANATLRLSLVLLPALACAALLGADAYVGWLFAKQYPQPVALTLGFAVLLALAGVDIVLGTLLNATDRQNLDVRAQAAGTALLALLLVALVPFWHGWGALGATVLALLLQSGLRVKFARASLGPATLPKETVKAVLLGVLAVALALALALSTPRWLQILLAMAALVIYPVLAYLLGAFAMGEVLLTLARPLAPGERPNERSLGGTLRILATDLRARRRICRGDTSRTGGVWIDNHGATAITLYRLSRLVLLNGHRHLARLFWYLNQTLTKVEIPPTTEIGPGFVVTHSVGVIVVGQVGSNVVMHGWSAIGIKGKRNLGAGAGVPIVGNSVEFRPRAAMQGAMRCPDGLIVPAHSLVATPNRLRAIATAAAEGEPKE